jgi:hypothetical protein
MTDTMMFSFFIGAVIGHLVGQILLLFYQDAIFGFFDRLIAKWKESK